MLEIEAEQMGHKKVVIASLGWACTQLRHRGCIGADVAIKVPGAVSLAQASAEIQGKASEETKEHKELQVL